MRILICITGCLKKAPKVFVTSQARSKLWTWNQIISKQISISPFWALKKLFTNITFSITLLIISSLTWSWIILVVSAQHRSPMGYITDNMGLVTLWIFWTQVAITDEWEISSAKGRIVEHRLDIDFHQLDLSSRYYQIKYCLLEFDNE